VPKEKKIYVGVSAEGIEAGVYQLNDDSSLCGAILLTNPFLSRDILPADLCETRLNNGRFLRLAKKGRRFKVVESSWAPAGQRIALSIPLHPDRMNQPDWTVLPGIGAKLAARIETDRQNNGDFGRFSNLVRVKGVGPQSLERWKSFFD
jgi:competence protein ComEA